MSTSMDVISEKLFNRFIIEFDALQREPLDNPIVLLEKYSEHYTNFSGNLNRLYDIMFKGEQIRNNFSKEMNLQIFKLSKEKVLYIINKSDNPDLVKKWDSIMESFEQYDNAENLYFVIDWQH